MQIDYANKQDIPELLRLLRQVLEVHASARPDIFKPGSTKYTPQDLEELIDKPSQVILVARDTKGSAVGTEGPAVDTEGTAVGTEGDTANAEGAAVGTEGDTSPSQELSSPLLGYAICEIQETHGVSNMQDARVFYLDDLCVDEMARGKHVGSALYEACLGEARKRSCGRLTLNVWSCNLKAQAFYEKMGLIPYKICLEKVLE